ncbi:hypothetical protein TEK04_19550 [Klenkia sp. LSe6-5]|uniref:Phage gp6-like head-tail connector protein n=1 Tax=Klenkia sesuvii TaxID=3103137 RepID=A0ABU8DYL6_9ACTN
MAVTHDDLAEYCGLSSVPTGAKLAEFDRFLNSAKGHVAARTSRVDGTVTLPVVSEGGRALALPAVFSATIGTVTSPSGATVLPVSTNPMAGVVQVATGEAGLWLVQVVGGAVPAELELAVLEIGRHLYNSQRITLRTDLADGVSAPVFSIPRRATELMEPYVMPGFA